MRAPRDINGKELEIHHYVRLSWRFLDELVTQEGFVTYSPSEDQFYIDEHPLQIYDTFEILN